jgi:hypothetical protein
MAKKKLTIDVSDCNNRLKDDPEYQRLDAEYHEAIAKFQNKMETINKEYQDLGHKTQKLIQRKNTVCNK